MAARSVAVAVCNEYVTLTSTTFDFGLKMNINVKKLKTKMTKVKGYGIVERDDGIYIIGIANTEWIARQTRDTEGARALKMSQAQRTAPATCSMPTPFPTSY